MRGSQHETNPYRLFIEGGGLRVEKMSRADADRVGAQHRRPPG